MTIEYESPLMRLRRLRTLRRMTQQDLADSLGVSTQTISNWETGQTKPKLTLADWRKLAKVLGVSMDELPNDFGPQPIHDGGPFATRPTPSLDA
jgi:DNA-binding XRE family transcriptional regulator